MARPQVAHPMQRVMVTLPPDLVASVSQVTQRQELAEQMKEGYLVNAERDRRICNEFAYADAQLGV